MNIYCCEYKTHVNARLTSGKEIYPYRADLFNLPFWKCDKCHNYVGCHYKTKNRTNPLGCIPNKKIMEARRHIHALIDPAWKSGEISRDEIYNYLSEKTGRNFHAANIRTIEEAREIYKLAKSFLVDMNYYENLNLDKI